MWGVLGRGAGHRTWYSTQGSVVRMHAVWRKEERRWKQTLEEGEEEREQLGKGLCQQRKHQSEARGRVCPVCSLAAQRGEYPSRVRKGKGKHSHREVEGLDLIWENRSP